MTLDGYTLRQANLPNLARLARALGVPVPIVGGENRRKQDLVRAVAREIERRRRVDEQRRQAEQTAAEIADTLGETGGPGQAPRARVVAQIARMIGVMGEEWVRDVVRVSRAQLLTETLRRDGAARNLGGMFFRAAKEAAHELEVSAGRMTRRTFFSTFCWREPTPRTPKPKAPPPPTRPVRKVVPQRGREPEVYTRRAR